MNSVHEPGPNGDSETIPSRKKQVENHAGCTSTQLAQLAAPRLRSRDRVVAGSPGRVTELRARPARCRLRPALCRPCPARCRTPPTARPARPCRAPAPSALAPGPAHPSSAPARPAHLLLSQRPCLHAQCLIVALQRAVS